MKKLIVRSLLVLLALVLCAVFFVYFYYFRTTTVDEPQLSSELKSTEMVFNGITRTLDYYIPADLKAGRPLVFILHGSMSKGKDVRKMTGYGFDQLADSEGFIAVYPNGYENHWNDCRGSADYAANVENIDDIQFFTAMIDHFAEHHHIDRGRVYATGHSNGGHMAYRLAFEMPGQFAAVAPISANIPVAGNLDCEKSGQPVSVAIFNGTNDPVNPYNGGLVEIMGDKSRGEVISAAASAAYWRELASAPQDPVTRVFPEVDGDANTKVILQSWQGKGDIEVRLYTLQGSGHVIPTGKVKFGRMLGGSAGDIEAADEIWNFFARHKIAAAQ
jgi:polyhydroxybutyrate depolymerase